MGKSRACIVQENLNIPLRSPLVKNVDLSRGDRRFDEVKLPLNGNQDHPTLNDKASEYANYQSSRSTKTQDTRDGEVSRPCGQKWWQEAKMGKGPEFLVKSF